MNVLDLVVIGIILPFVLICYKNGFVISVYNFAAFMVSTTLTNVIYPYVSKAIKNVDVIYYGLKNSVHSNIGLTEYVKAATKKEEIDLISSLKLPGHIKTMLIDNNNPEIYKALNVNSIEDYISGFITNTIINIVAMMLVFIIVFALIKILGTAINIISKLPVINTANKMVGALLGLIEGTFAVWIILAAFVWFCAANGKFPVNELIQSSSIAKYFYETNFILKLVGNIF